MQQTCYPIADPSAATALLEKILSRKCKLHPQFPCEFIHIKPTESSPRLCCQCIQNVSSNDYVSIRYLLQASSHTTIKDYPKLTDSSIAQKLQEFKGSDAKVSEALLSFFDNLQSTVSAAIEKQKSAQKIKLASFQSCYQGIYDTFAQMSQIEKFKQLVKDNNDNEELLQRFIGDQYLNANNYTQAMMSKLSEYQQIYSSFSLTDPKNKLGQIVKLIEGIQVFPTILQSQVNNNSQQQPAVLAQNPPLQQQIEQQSSLSSPATGQQQQQQLGQQQKQKQQQQSSLSQYNYYVSLIEQGLNKNILWVESSQSSSSWVGLWSPELGWLLGSYAKTYMQWQGFSEDERQRQLSSLKQLLQISD